MKKAFSEYTEIEFISELDHLINACGTASDDDLADLLEKFESITGHPAGSDLIYYPEPGADTSAGGITKTIKEWRAANGLPGFKA
ncbi:bacteriocin immunity protein [Pseudomonas sp. MAFF 212408]|uniref:Bacteriocin immunity protein n=1 Tax=Pseudomonas kitaguniensis TaxID=2607908 RepID=A0A5N7KLH1_9PSED|nr:bacteriocin immunity protein [Pseudomonas kitaguniensis]MPR02890.1 bacteriocin immunity protein [Pseudomonas kitaguniensis]